MGVQALNDADLRRLGRLHSSADARRAFDIARKQFDRVSFDLIYARQDQTLDDWRTELTDAIAMAVDHLSLYQLTIEPGTAFGDRFNAGKLRGLPVDDLAADMYQETQEICDRAGLPAYEISNHARPGAESRHNRVYWRYGDYIGIGPGAHGRLTLNGTRHTTEQWLMPGKWLLAAEQGNADEALAPLTPDAQGAEFLMMGLRLSEGVDPRRYAQLTGQPLPAHKLGYLSDIGMIEHSPTHLRTTDQGRVLLNAVLETLLVE
jgi:oxygen-independent coproporphyrinogen-3 oxidase